MCKIGFLFLVTSFLSSCSSTPPLSTAQRRAMQTKTYQEASYENVFRAFKSVLQDEAYVIENQDMDGGLILAKTSREVQPAFGGGFGRFMHNMDRYGKDRDRENYKTGTELVVSVNLEKISDLITETRMIMNRKEKFKFGEESARQINNPEAYRHLYNLVDVEIQRRNAFGR